MEHLKSVSLGLTPPLLTNIILDWKDLPKTNTLTYWGTLISNEENYWLIKLPQEPYSQDFIFFITFEWPKII